MANIITNLTNLNFSMTNYEIACLLSHLKTLYEISKYEGKYFLILEDDADISNI